MNLELDDGSEILGTHIVRKNGIITGFSAHEGRKVLVILLPERTKEVEK